MQMHGLVMSKTRCSPIQVVFVGIKLPDFLKMISLLTLNFSVLQLCR